MYMCNFHISLNPAQMRGLPAVQQSIIPKSPAFNDHGEDEDNQGAQVAAPSAGFSTAAVLAATGFGAFFSAAMVAWQ